MGVGGQRHAPGRFTPGKGPLPIVQEVGWATGPVLIGAENLASAGIRSSEGPASRYTVYALPAYAYTAVREYSKTPRWHQAAAVFSAYLNKTSHELPNRKQLHSVTAHWQFKGEYTDKPQGVAGVSKHKENANNNATPL